MTGQKRRILLATTNRHKVREVTQILAAFGIEVLAPAALPPVVEDGATFEENARKKAFCAARSLGRPAAAEDSGIEVEALGGAPGVYSARYAGEGATDEQNLQKLLREIAARGLADPKAAYVCSVVLASPDGRVLASAEGRVEGVVRGPPRGTNGFGYDPIFHFTGPGHPPPGRRFAEMSPAEKDALSHRGRAFRALAASVLALDPGTLGA